MSCAASTEQPLSFKPEADCAVIDAQQFKNATGRYPRADDLDRVNCQRVGNLGHYFCGWCGDCQMPRFICGHPVPAAQRHGTEYTCIDCGRLVVAFGDHSGTLCATCEWIRQSTPPVQMLSSVRRNETTGDVQAYFGALGVLAMAAAMGWSWFVLVYLAVMLLTVFVIAAWEREGANRRIALPLLVAAMWPVTLLILLIRAPFGSRFDY